MTTPILTPENTMVPSEADVISPHSSSPSISFVDDMRAFNRMYQPSRAAWRAGEKPLSMYFSTHNDEENTRRYGIEIEFNAAWGIREGECNCNDYDCECPEEVNERNVLSEWMFDYGLLPSPCGGSYHEGEGQYDKWRYESDCTVTGGEVISPIMDGTKASWVTIAKVMQKIKSFDGEADGRACGGHISIDVPDLATSLANKENLFALALRFEDVMYRLAANPYRTNRATSPSYHRGYSYAIPFLTRQSENAQEEDHRRMCGWYWLSYKKSYNRLEFRIFDGTLDPALAQTWTMIANALVNASLRDNIEEVLSSMPQRPAGYHLHRRRLAGFERRSALTGAAWKADTLAIRQFVDLLFTRTEDKERVITLFAANDWNVGYNERRY